MIAHGLALVYARDGQVPEGFEAEVLGTAMVGRQSSVRSAAGLYWAGWMGAKATPRNASPAGAVARMV